MFIDQVELICKCYELHFSKIQEINLNKLIRVSPLELNSFLNENTLWAKILGWKYLRPDCNEGHLKI